MQWQQKMANNTHSELYNNTLYHRKDSTGSQSENDPLQIICWGGQNTPYMFLMKLGKKKILPKQVVSVLCTGSAWASGMLLTTKTSYCVVRQLGSYVSIKNGRCCERCVVLWSDRRLWRLWTEWRRTKPGLFLPSRLSLTPFLLYVVQAVVYKENLSLIT